MISVHQVMSLAQVVNTHYWEVWLGTTNLGGVLANIIISTDKLIQYKQKSFIFFCSSLASCVLRWLDVCIRV